MTNETYTLGSMCTGAGMLEAGMAQILPIDVRWHAEKDDDASEVLKRRYPLVPNHGDITLVDWASVEPVEILCGGFPCQPFSLAGKQLGQADGRFLFDDIADAISTMVTPPRMCLFENVPGLLTVDRGQSMARVVHRLAALGYMGRYRVVQAADVGACHERARVFILATHRDWNDIPRVRGTRDPVLYDGISRLLPTPAARLGNYDPPSAAVSARRLTEGKMNIDDWANLLTTPRARDWKVGGKDGLEIALLPTPRASDGEHGGPGQRGRHGDLMMPSAAMLLVENFGVYAEAIARWAVVSGRMPPPATVPNAKGEPRLGARFPEWMMGWPDGWVTDLVSRKAALRIVGNGVVPQQSAAAFRLLLDGSLT